MTEYSPTQIGSIFPAERPIDRRIERVIDYAATDDDRLQKEVDEYVVTPSVEQSFRTILENFEEGVSGADVAEIGIWVSGFYGSGKSSFTKYLGFALDPQRKVGGVPFVSRLADRVPSPDVRQLFKAVAAKHPTAVFMLDLATDQQAESAQTSVANVLYWRVLRELGYSTEKKIAQLELRLEADGKFEAFKRAYQLKYPDLGTWEAVHNDTLFGIRRASQLVPEFYGADFKSPEDFSQLKFELNLDVRDLAKHVIALIRKHRKCDAILFLVDEVGQYVAPRNDLILNLDGLVRAFKEEGKGKVWFVATAQQTLTEISEKAALNSRELFRLKDRFPISIDLKATDIRDITLKRLLQKNPAAHTDLKARFREHGEALRLHTTLGDWPSATTLDADSFAHFYPILPDRFDLVLDLIRALARRTGGTGLRSAIKMVQDILVDASKSLSGGTKPMADRAVGKLAAADDVYDILRTDIERQHRHAIEGVERIARHGVFGSNKLAVRVAKAVALLQPLETRPRTAENLAALLYAELGAAGELEAVREVLQKLVDCREFGLVEIRGESKGAAGSGFMFLSDEVQPFQRRRDEYQPTTTELNEIRLKVLGKLFDPLPEAKVEMAKSVSAALRLDRGVVAGENGDVTFRIERVDPSQLEARRAALAVDTQARSEYAAVVIWLVSVGDQADDALLDACRSAHIQMDARGRDREAKADVARFLRSEERRAERAREAAQRVWETALHKGWFVFRGQSRAVAELGATVHGAAAAFLKVAAERVFDKFRLAPKNAAGDVAPKFLEVERLDRMTRDRDPLHLVQQKDGRWQVATGLEVLHEVLRRFRELVLAAGTQRIQGSVVLDTFNAPPYGWSKDTTRYIFAALLVAGEVELFATDGVLKTAGPKAQDAVRNTQSFGRIGIGIRGSRPSVEALTRAAQRLEAMFGVELLPLEDQVSRTVRNQFPSVLEKSGALPDSLRLLELPGVARARKFLELCADLIKEDAGGATSLLGTKESTVQADYKWMLSVVLALKAGEGDIRAARRLETGLRELAGDFSATRDLVELPGLATLREVLTGEHFAERMDDLRVALAGVGQVLIKRNAEELATYRLAVDGLLQRLEAMPEWPRLSDDDRASVAEDLAGSNLPSEPTGQDAVVLLRRVLTRRAQLPELEQGLVQRVRTLAVDIIQCPPPKMPDRPNPPAETADVAFDSLLPERDLCTAADVDQWLNGLRPVLHERVRQGPIRLKGGA